MIGRELGLSEDDLKTLENAGLLHDIGKIGMPENILNKPERLTDEEFEVVKSHPTTGSRMLKGVKQLDGAAIILRHHHERLDGRGYPDGLANDAIPLFSRILAAADTYDAITSDRPYRKRASRQKALDELRRCAGTQFDPDVIEALNRIEANGLLELINDVSSAEADALAMAVAGGIA